MAMQEFYCFIRKESNYTSYVAFYDLFGIRNNRMYNKVIRKK